MGQMQWENRFQRLSVRALVSLRAHMVPHEILITLREVLRQSDYQQDMTETIWVIENEEAVKAKDIHETEQIPGTAFSKEDPENLTHEIPCTIFLAKTRSSVLSARGFMHTFISVQDHASMKRGKCGLARHKL